MNLSKSLILILLIITTNLFAIDQLKILVAKNRKSLSLKTGRFKIFDEQVGDRLIQKYGRHTIKITLANRGDQKGLRIMGRFYPTSGVVIESKKGFLVKKKQLHFKLAVTRFKGMLFMINILPLEQYLAGIVNSEISSKWPLEAIKAQVVVSRTYALRKKIRNFTRPYDLNTSVLDQVYRGMRHVDQRSIDAVKATYGEVITYNHHLIQGFFFANSGGHTEDASYFAGRQLPYIKGKPDPYSLNMPRGKWSIKISQKRLTALLKRQNLIKGKLQGITAAKISSGDRWLKVKLISDKTVTIQGEHLRRLVGYNKLYSTKFTVTKRGNYFIFNGGGSGHGVGMSQWGAHNMAKGGKRYREIINFYYNHIKLMRIY